MRFLSSIDRPCRFTVREFLFYIVVLGIDINTQKPPCGNREAFKAIFSCPKVVQIENTTSGKHVNTPYKWGDTYLLENISYRFDKLNSRKYVVY